MKLKLLNGIWNANVSIIKMYWSCTGLYFVYVKCFFKYHFLVSSTIGKFNDPIHLSIVIGIFVII